ncbi:hypothetical protein BDQ17DRAFT_1432339 [Cyathus striatus]|nr:hypothetical protein BDQ17DRAFT_1432339 [Cyathus striatus]
MSTIFSTPITRIEVDEERRYLEIKGRVADSDPNKGRCLVENCSSTRSIEHCHVIPRKFWKLDTVLDSLEWNWNLKKGDLNLDTRYNIFCAGSSVHKMFDKHRWILLPDQWVVDAYERHISDPKGCERCDFPTFEDANDFEYKIIPIHEMEEVAFTRQKTNFSTPLGPESFTIYTYPFETFPKVNSHIHPKFVIVSIGDLLESHPDITEDITVKYPILGRISDIYNAWVDDVPDDANQDKTYHDSDGDDSDSDLNDEDYEGSDKGRQPPTEKGRGPSGIKRPRQDSPTPPGPNGHPMARRSATGSNNGQKRKVIEGVQCEDDDSDIEYRDCAEEEKGGSACPSTEHSCLSEDTMVELTDGIGKLWDDNALTEWSRNVDLDRTVLSV